MHSSSDELQAFERLLAELSAGFIGLAAERIDAAIEDALRRIVLALDIDRCSLIVVSPVTGRIETTHSWALEGVERTPWLNIGQSNPWALSMAQAGRPVVFARLDEVPTEAAVDKATWRRVGLKSHVGMPLLVAGKLARRAHLRGAAPRTRMAGRAAGPHADAGRCLCRCVGAPACRSAA